MLDGTEDEDKFLAAGIAGLQQNAFYMHRALVTSSKPYFIVDEDDDYRNVKIGF